MFEDFFLAAGIKENGLAVIFNQRCKTSGPLQPCHGYFAISVDEGGASLVFLCLDFSSGKEK
jgi:hypothetical protein